MKRASALTGLSLFTLGIPTTLIIGGFTPGASLVGASFSLFAGNWEIFLLHSASALLWLIWLYVLLAFIHDLWQLKVHHTAPKPSLGFRRWIAVGATAVWSLLITSRTFALMRTSLPADVTLDSSEHLKSRSDVPSESSSSLPLALSASIVTVAGILQLVRQLRAKVLRESVPNSQIRPLSRRSQSTVTELRLAEATASCDGIREAMNSLTARETSPILASWRPHSTPRDVLTRPGDTIGSSSLCCVPLGIAQGEIILLTLLSGTTISVGPDEGGRARSVLAHLVHSIVLETVGSNTSVIVCGFTDAELIKARHLTTVKSVEHLLVPSLRAKSSDPAIVCSVNPLSMDTVNRLQEMGYCVVTASHDVVGDVALVHTEHGWSIRQASQLISLYGITSEECIAVSRLVNEVSRPTIVPAVDEQFTAPHEWKVIIRVLGPTEVMTRDGRSIRFEKSKSVELLAWLTTHRSRPSRNAARTALWEVNVQDATFTNVVSDVRRNLAKVIPLTDGEEWLPRTFTDALPLHGSVITDGELLDKSIRRASCLDSDTALSELRVALEYVRDLPFSGTNYLWPDSEGITTQLTLSVMTSAVMASELYLERGDTEGVFWATGRGLKVLPGHEELLALRMRAHALKGDLAAVRAEWGSHQRAIARDAWSGGATSPKLNELCRALLQSSRRDVYSVSE